MNIIIGVRRLIMTLLLGVVWLPMAMAQDSAGAQDVEDMPDYAEDSVAEMTYRMYRADADLYIRSKEYQMKSYDFYIKELDRTHRRLVWHAHASTIIFWLVVFIVLAGIAFSAIQFYMALRVNKGKMVKPKKGKAAPPPTEDDDDDMGETKLKVSKDGIEVSSSIMGIIILVLSIAFFYLYLTIVYPIKGVNDPAPTEQKK
jgi:hypothetical protein